jgi:hypothetical protein
MDRTIYARRARRLLSAALAGVLGFALPAGGVLAAPTGSTLTGCWRMVPAVNQGTGDNELNAVAAASSSDVWAVGSYSGSGGLADRTLTERWNGSGWTVVPSPNVFQSSFNNLYGVAAVSSSDAWAVGYALQYVQNVGYMERALTMHWDGGLWTIVPIAQPSPGEWSSNFNGVRTLASNSVWAAGWAGPGSAGFGPLVERWNGSTWNLAFPGAGYRLYGVAALSNSDVWAVGDQKSGSAPYRTLAVHWNGSTWSSSPVMNGNVWHNHLYGVAAASSNDVWVVGEYETTYQGAEQALVLHWNGASWGGPPVPTIGARSTLRGVTALSANDAWAVGYYLDPTINRERPLAMHWDGSSWSIVTAPGVTNWNNRLRGIAAASSADLWAVGSIRDSNSPYLSQTLVERYFDPCPGSHVYHVLNGLRRLEPGVYLLDRSQCDDCVTPVSLPFAYTLYGRQFERALAGDNGTLSFTSDRSVPDNACLPAPGLDYTIFPYWDDLTTRCDGCGIYTGIGEREGGRVFNIEWRGMTRDGEPVNFEVSLHERQSAFDVVYGSTGREGSSATVGVTGSPEAEGEYTEYACDTGGLRPGLMLTFTQDDARRRVATGAGVGMPRTGDNDGGWEPWLALPLVLVALGLGLKRRERDKRKS